MTCDQLPCRNIERDERRRAEVRRHDAELLQELREDVARQRQLVEPRDRVQDDDRDGDVRRGPGRNDVPKGIIGKIALAVISGGVSIKRPAPAVGNVRRGVLPGAHALDHRRRSPSPIALRCSPMVMTA